MGRATNNIERNLPKVISWFFSRNSAAQKGVARSIERDEREKKSTTKKNLQPRILELPYAQAGFKKAEQPEIKLPTSVWSQKKEGNSRKPFTYASLAMLKLLTVWITTNRKILKEMGISYHLTCLLRNLYVGQEAIVRTRHGTMNWFKIGKGVQGCMLLPCLFKLYVEYIMQNVRLDESQAEIKIAGRNINNPRYADNTT